VRVFFRELKGARSEVEALVAIQEEFGLKRNRSLYLQRIAPVFINPSWP
jgi:hypothetical protein